MKINVNEKKQAQCPGCGEWNDLQLDKDGLCHEFTCCRRNFAVHIDVENLEKLSRGELD